MKLGSTLNSTKQLMVMSPERVHNPISYHDPKVRFSLLRLNLARNDADYVPFCSHIAGLYERPRE